MVLCGPNEIKLGRARKRKRGIRCSVSACNGLLVAKLWALSLPQVVSPAEWSKRHRLVRHISFYWLIAKGASQFGFTRVASEARPAISLTLAATILSSEG
jgi:hypothetical protein